MYDKLKQILYRCKLTREGGRWVAAAGYIKSAPSDAGGEALFINTASALPTLQTCKPHAILLYTLSPIVLLNGTALSWPTKPTESTS